MYTQHNVFFIMYLTPLIFSILATLMFWTGFINTKDSGEFIVDVVTGLFGAAIGPVMGLIFLMQRGPLRIDALADYWQSKGEPLAPTAPTAPTDRSEDKHA